MTLQHFFGIIITLLSIVLLSIYSGKAEKDKKGANSLVVAGIIMGTLVGGSSTVGTAQLAYQYGMSAWWFTLGSGIACLILAVFFAKPLYESKHKTLIEFITHEYGKKNGLIASVLSSFGSFINIISQLIASTAIIAVIAPDIPLYLSLLFSALFMVLYVIFGGTKGSGWVGILKMLLLYLAMIASGILVLVISNGLEGFINLVNSIDNYENIRFGSLFARGAGEDLGACLSLILGVITTQSYAQAIFAASDSKEAIKGAVASSFLIPPVGIGGILVGLYMRSTHPGIVPKTALTLFVTENMPPLLGGVVLGALFIAVVGTGAGLALGISTVLRRDVLPEFRRTSERKFSEVAVEKVLIVLILITACVLSMGPLGDTILKFAFMSMGLRGATIFLPLCCAMWCSGKIDKKYAGVAIVSGPLFVLIFELWGILPFDSLFAGIVVSAVVMLMGYFSKKTQKTNKCVKT